MARQVVKAEADRLEREFGVEAYAKALASMRLAKRARNARMSLFLASVAEEILRRLHKELGTKRRPTRIGKRAWVSRSEPNA